MKVMDHRIVNEPLKFFKSAARMELKGRWLEAAVASGIYVIIVGIVGFIVESLFPTLSFITGIYTLIIFGPAVVGLYAYFMRIVRRQPTNVRDCFEGFEDFGRSLSLGVQMMVRVMLWTLLFIIPGIIAAYRYSQAPLLLRDHPDWTPGQCISESKRLMVGNKGTLFTLEISFIGWYILACLPAIVFAAAYGAAAGVTDMTSLGFPLTLVMLIFEIPILFVYAYMKAADVVFYEELNRPVQVYTVNNMGGNAYNDSGSYGAYDPNGFSGDFSGDDLFDDM